MDKNKYIDGIRKAVQHNSHPGVPDYDLFQATSVMALFVFNNEIELLFIQKADVKGYPWANQMAFPGGHKDKTDLSTRDTALRELAEEMGIVQENVEVIGSFGHFQTINSKDIEAFAGIWNQKDVIRHDAAEISRVFKIPLKYLIGVHKKKDFHLHKPNIMQLTYPYEDVVIWGVTAKILYHLLDSLLQNADFVSLCTK
ncbi:MAG: CoA pyrophosphatase [Deltaproteobacteria bacterium]|jgi:coenzyme A diphosphatase NUDT7|nr:CoA pyrophosphatase [Deltaproteobacteria bacterium]